MSRTTVVILIAAVLLLGVGVFFFLSGPGRELIGPLYFKLRPTPKMQLVLQVQVQDAVKEEAELVIGSLLEELGKAQIPYTAIDRSDPSTIEQADTIRIDLKGIPAARQGELRSLVSARFPGWTLTPVSETDYRLTPAAAELAVLKRDTVELTLATIQKRLRGLGVIGRAFRRPGGGSAAYEIVMQLADRPNDPARVAEIFVTRARLEITPAKGGPFSNREEALAKYGGALPLGTRLAKGVPRGGEGVETWYLLSRTPVITGRDLRNARASRDEMGRWETDFTLSKDGAQRFGRFTEANIGNRLAIVLEEQVRSAPTIQSRIEDSGRISGAGNEQEAYDLALLLRSGSLPAGIRILEER
jgi:preprotein translocase subunit SecD